MGVMKRMGNAKQSKSRRSGRTVGVVVSQSMIEDMLEILPIELREKAVKEANKAAGRIVRNEARKLAPKGEQTGTTKKQSRKQRDARANRQFTLSKSIWTKTKSKETSVLTMVGPRRPDGNAAHLIEFGHKKVLWGKETGEEVQGKPFLRPAGDNTRTQQRAAIIKKLKQMFDKV